ncbi:diguanylate cyclase [Rhodoferax sp. WC2427]|uniref:GGDEF domain-containing protein n=1 Tax=Rhodoferax sp. WC2427 TaxID=3234144 RepID=UPI0034654822
MLTPAVRIALGLVSLMVTLVLIGEVFTGYPPDREASARRHRGQVARIVGGEVVVALRTGVADLPAPDSTVQRVLKDAQLREPKLLSVRVIGASGQPLAQVGEHARGWRLEPGELSNADNIRVPLISNGNAWGEVQLVFEPALPTTLRGWLHDPLAQWLVFIAGVGFVAFALYLRRVLRHLDPNAAVPERVRNAFDTLTEGVLVLDLTGRIMLANQAFCELCNENAQALTGVDANKLTWMLAALPPDAQAPPWRQAVQQKKAVLGVPLTLELEGLPRRELVMNCAPITEGANQVRGCLATFSDVTELHERTERLQVAMGELSASQREIERKNEELTLLATRDALTGIFNRRSLMQQAEQRFAEAGAAATPISCIMCDIDHFKQVNDKFGHAGGDQVIQGAAKALSRGLRLGDFVGRYGGEEFCIILPGGTAAQAVEIAERLREDIDANLGSALRDHVGVKVTMSFGVAEIGPHVPDPATLIDLADQALYHSKKNGRNRVTTWSPTAVVSAEPIANG